MARRAENRGDPAVQAFWNRYRGALARHGITGKAAFWAEKRAKDFVARGGGGKLAERTAEDVRAYFSKALTRRPLDGWQIAQWVDAVRILYDGPVRTGWAGAFEWEQWKEPHLNFPALVERYHADVSTTMIYTHVLNRPGLAVRSPADLAPPPGSREPFQPHP